MSHPGTPRVARRPHSAPQGPLVRAWSAVLRPGVRAMRKLTLTQRVLLTSAALMLPLLLMMLMAARLVWADRAVTMSELEGVRVHTHLVSLVTSLQDLREEARRVVGGDASREAAVAGARATLAEALARVDEQITANADGAFDAVWAPLLEQVQALQGTLVSDVPAASTRAIAELHKLVLFNAEVSQLLIDPKAISYFLMDVAVVRTLPLIEAAASTDQLGANLLRVEHANQSERLRMLNAASQMRRGLSEIQATFEALARAGGSTPGSWTGAMEALEDYASHLERAFASDILDGDPVRHQDMAESAYRQLLAVHADTVQRLRAALELRAADGTRQLALLVAVSALAFLLLGYLVVISMLAVQSTLRVLMRGAHAVATGDLTGVLRLQGRDEVARIGAALDQMAVRLSSLVATIRSDASQVSMAGTQLTEGSMELSARTAQQGECLTKAALAVGALSGAVASSATESSDLDTLCNRLHDQSQAAGAVMVDTVQAMQAVQGSAEQVSAIVSLLDDLAFQTGMLALNASIEAAKAGAAGHGFSIVATEVRHLAIRSAEASDQIRHLVSTSSDQVRLASGRLSSASDTSREVAKGIEQISKRLAKLSESAIGQSGELSGVTAMIGNLDKLTRDNARLVEQTASASADLLQRAQALGSSVASMRLRQGSADEAKALVVRALRHLQSVGREQALRDFHDPKSGFIDRDLYLAVVNPLGVYSAMGVRPDMVGRTMAELPGLDSRSVLAQTVAAAERGGGWIRYTMINPAAGELQVKDSWVAPFENGEMVLCGVFRPLGADGAGRRVATSWTSTGMSTAPAPPRPDGFAAPSPAAASEPADQAEAAAA